VGLLSLVFVGGAWMARAADEATAPQGLTGILPAAAPADLEATLASLPENWQPWGAAVTAELGKLYAEPTAEIADQKAVLAQLRKREATAAQYLANPAYRNIASQLSSLRGSLKRRLDVAEAILSTLEIGPEAVAQRKTQAARELNAAAVNLSNNLNAVSTGAGWRKYLKTAEIQEAVKTNNPEQILAIASTVKEQFEKAPTDDVTQQFMKRADIVALRTAAGNALAAGQAVPPGAELRQACTELVAAIELAESETTSAAAKGVRDAYSKIAAVAPDGGVRITTALRANYFNHNVRVYAPEKFINRFVSESRRDNSGINEFVSEAQVTGSQSTLSNVGIDVQPSNNGALMYLVINGTVNTSTLASTSEANVSIFGNANFNAYKPLVFDGEKFKIGQTAVGARASSSLGNIDTKYDGMPLIGRIAQGQAQSIASSRLGEGEAMMANRIRGTVASQLDTEINREFGPNGELPKKLDERVAALKNLKLFPAPLSWTSTHDEVRMAGRIMEAGELGGSAPDATQMNPRGLTILLHQSALNNGIDRLGFAGQTLSDDQLRDKLQKHMEDLLGQKVDMGTKTKPASEESAARLLSFDANDPIRIEAIDDTLVLNIRAGLKQEGKEEIPVHLIRVPMSIKAVTEGIQITPGNVSVETIDKSESQAVRAGVIKKKIEEAITEQLVKRSVSVKRGNRQFTLAVTRVRTNDGWLNIWVE
ncbi:MAG: hypothetical protein NT069_10645, partial [Planctomycetota bacterium]|nr:hypothetical protein [Planctomycetota bacterium]